MAKQTFTTGQVLTAAQMTSLQQTAMLGGDASAKVASYVLAAADAGTAITMSNGSATTITVNTGLFAAGDIVTIINLGAGVCTITAGTATVTTSGSLALAQNQGGVLRFTSASAAIFFQFATPASGDIEGVSAGVGISGGGTSGTVTITNSMATEIDAKGDLVPGTGADTFARLAVGANETRLVADSAAATGLKYVADTTNYAIAAKGDLLVGTGADTLAALTVGTNGYTLVADSSTSTGLKWAAAAAGGKVLQVVYGTYNTVVSITTTTYTDTGLSLNITPTSATSKILVIANQAVYFSRSSSIQAAGVRLVRGSTTILQTTVQDTSVGIAATGATFVDARTWCPLLDLDEPATTSTLTYKVQGSVYSTANSGQVAFQEGTNVSQITLIEIGA
jgi:hypothetical protein